MAGRARLTRDQRGLIEEVLTADPVVSWTELGRRVGVHRSTVQREVDGNRGRVKYCAVSAHAAAVRAARRPREGVLAAESVLRDRVVAQLREKRSPAAIAADLRAEGAGTVTAETIYRAVYAGDLPFGPEDCLRRKRRRRRKRQARVEPCRPGRPNIESRPDAVNSRLAPGHFELDLIVGARNRSAMLVAVERLTRYSALVTLPEGYRAEAVLAAMVELFDQVPAHLLGSATFDQGSEWADWECLVEWYGLDVWFCQPHSPWQRGAVENHNGHVRAWFPRGIDLSVVTPQEADGVARVLNTQRRKIHGWESAEQRWLAAGGQIIESVQSRSDKGLVVAGG